MSSIPAPQPRSSTGRPCKYHNQARPLFTMPLCPVNNEDPFDPFIEAPSQRSTPPHSLLPAFDTVPHRCFDDCTKRKIMNKSPSPCSTIKSPVKPGSRRSRRARPSCPILARPSVSPFDHPWTSILDDTAPITAVWDVADLSQLKVPKRVDISPADGPGPDRPRKRARRSSPVKAVSRKRSSQDTEARHATPEPEIKLKPHLSGASAPESGVIFPVDSRVLRTPPPRFSSHKDVQFWNLMPLMSPRPSED